MKGPKLVFIFGILISLNNLLATPLSLKSAVDLSLEKSPEYLQAREQFEIAKLNYKTSFYAFFPTLMANANHGLKDDYLLRGDNPHQSSFSLTAKENLYDNGKSLTAHRLARAGEELENLKIQEARENLAYKNLKAYIRISLARLVLDLRNVQHERLVNQYKSVKNQFEQGLKLRRDFLRFQAQVSRSELSLKNSEQEIFEALLELKKLLGDVELGHLEIQDLAIKENKIPEFKSLLTAEDSFEYRSGRLRNKIAHENVDLKIRENYPQLNLVGELSYGASQYWKTGQNLKSQDYLTGSVFLNLNYTIFDWGTQRRGVAVARAQARIEEQAVRAQEMEITSQLKKLNQEIPQSLDKLRLSTELKTLESRSFQFLETEYREGRINYLDLNQARENFLSATESFYKSYFEWLDNFAVSLKIGGKLYAFIQQNEIL